MKILYHHRTRSKDGQNVHIEELIGALRGLGHEVVVVAPPAMEEKAFGADAGAVSTLKRLLPRALYEILELAYSVVAYRRLAAACRRHRPDVLYERYNLFLLAGLWLKRKYRLPMLLEINAPLAFERGRFGGLGLPWLARWCEGRVWRGADRVLPVTEALADMVGDAGVPRERITVIANGVDPARFADVGTDTAISNEYGLDDRLVLGFTGFVREWHRLDIVIDFIADSDPGLGLHLLLVGDGPARPALERRADARGIADRVTITGIVARDDVACHIAAFDIALQPAVQPYASPLKLLEYMALGRPIVAPAMPNIEELLSHERTALLFDPKRDGAFRAALERLCRDAALRRRLGAAARDAIDAQGLTWEHNARRVTALFDALRPAMPG